ncbi:putative rRNA methylase [Halanaerobium saccharolyticum]|uniref:Putative rRNA methylase n=1 Tax=Halanaerobium saccharolyticum TaxID=43595 RepID=A0A4R7Z6P5_9FIRM|nr:class I SAM-dependent methyltransferase [Halanaerobium saccharolyticum]RAK11172.1 putative rRNA methylase [Halanaerobium saccharolyticum]TDW07023.1 putative rRNA methylase [Halanaerobium saccharolyticum]TDX63788.1 putative rRNA methylase [Halanaerobium saccharolyticum]
MQKDFLNAVEFSHLLLKENVEAGDLVIDATAGNGHDTKYLAELVGADGKVFAFDIQEKAIDQTRELLKMNELSARAELILDSHAKIDQYLTQKISAAIFNLGYLPGGNKEIITRSESTISALKKSIELLKKNGIVILVIYSGHSGGEEEKNELLDFASALDYKKFNVLNYEFLNQPGTPPQVLAIKKRI